MDAIPSSLRTAYEAAAQLAAGYPPALCAARLALLKGLQAAGVVVEPKDFAEYCRRVERQTEAGRVTA